MPRRARKRRRRSDLRLSPEPGDEPAAGQKVRTEITKPLARLNNNPVFPVYAGPLLIRRMAGGN